MISMTLYKLSDIVSSHSLEPKGARALAGSATVSLIETSRNGSSFEDTRTLGNANVRIGHDNRIGG